MAQRIPNSPPELVAPKMPTSPEDSSSLFDTQHGEEDSHQERRSGGVTVYSPGAPMSTALNPRSCVTCRRRKVRCDKHMPCSNCKRAHIPCIFPAPGRAPRRPRPKDPNAAPKQPSSERELELMKRLRKLEGIVEELSGQVEVEAARRQSSAGNSPETQAGGDTNTSGSGSVGGAHAEAPGGAGGGGARDALGHCSPGLGPSSRGSPITGRLIAGNHPTLGPLHKSPVSEANRHLGRLVIHEGGSSRYVSSGFWSQISDEVSHGSHSPGPTTMHLISMTQNEFDADNMTSKLEQIRAEAEEELTGDDLEESDTETTPDVPEHERSSANHQSFILGYRSADVDLRPLHPLPSQIPFIWSIYQENVDPVIKVLHTPTMNKLIREVRLSRDVLTPATEALMFSIYYAAITSMEEEDVTTNFGTDKSFLLSQYRFATEQALAKANFLTSSDIVTCQALLLLLQLVRRHDDTRFAWTLTGLACRIAQSLGLHRDGTNFPNLTPFEIEMRRRLFWAIAILDLRSAEDQGTDLVLVDRTFDTQLPLNINDADIGPETAELPEPRDGSTDMSFSLIRYEICAFGRRMHAAASASANVCPRDAAATLEEREQMLRALYGRLENTYLRDGSAEENPMFWVAANIARVVVAKLTLIIYQPLLFPGPSHDMLSTERRQRLTTAAIEIFECQQRLNSDPRSKQWRWLFQTYMQWHAVAYLLLECSHRFWTATMERAWTAVNSALNMAKQVDLARMTHHTAVWLPFRKLFAKSRRHRDAEIARLKADPQAALQLDLEDTSSPVPSTFLNLSGSVKSAVARERWRKLVNCPPLPPELARSQAAKSVPPSAGTLDLLARSSIPPPDDAALDNGIALVDEAITAPTFQPDQFLAAAWANAPEILDGSQKLFYDSGGANVPPQGLGRFPSVPGTLSGAPAPINGSQTSSGLTVDDYPPPYLWSSPEVRLPVDSEETSIDSSTQLANLPLDDVDVNMDDGFDWQDWHENLRGFELAGGGGVATAMWGNGI